MDWWLGLLRIKVNVVRKHSENQVHGNKIAKQAQTGKSKPQAYTVYKAQQNHTAGEW